MNVFLVILIIILILAFIDAYVFQAFKTLTKKRWIHWLFISHTLILCVYLIIIVLTFDRSIGPGPATLTFGAVFILFFVPKLIVFTFLFLEDVVRLGRGLYNYFSKNNSSEKSNYIPSRRKFVSQLALGVATIPFTAIVYGVFRGKYNYKVIHHSLNFEDLPASFDGLKITHISDIHSGSFDNAEKVQYAIDLINEQNTDLILFTGDIVNTKASEMDPWLDIFSGINTPRFGKYSVLGNHDYGEYLEWPSKQAKDDNFNAIKNIHEKIGFKLLLNESVFLEKENEKIALVGVENWGHNFKQAGDLNKASEFASKNDFKILMSHDPSHWEHEVKMDEMNYQLTLSGHTHGLQFGIEIPGYLKWSPAQYVYKQWAGLYEEFGRYINVNRGFGFHGYSGRVGIWPEITVLTLNHSGAKTS